MLDMLAATLVKMIGSVKKKGTKKRSTYDICSMQKNIY